MTREEIVAQFLGRSPSLMYGMIEQHLGHPLAEELKAEFAGLFADAFERELAPVTGVVELLGGLGLPSCVASSSTPESLRRKLTRVGLYEFFAGRIFSAVEVAEGKPAPDLFLHAARQMGHPPDRCAVVEDSRYGVLAARAAGMHCFAFESDLVDPETLRGPGTTLFSRMDELRDLLSRGPRGPGATA